MSTGNQKPNVGNLRQPEREIELLTEDSDLFVCRSNDGLNLDADPFRPSDLFGEPNCIVSSGSGELKSKSGRIETFNQENPSDDSFDVNTVKIYVKVNFDLVLKSDEQVILQCSKGNKKNCMH